MTDLTNTIVMLIDPRGEPDAQVACNGCTACCHREVVMLVEGDDPALYPEALVVKLENPLTGAKTTTIIPVRGDGACIYLGPGGCTIYDKRPKMCRVFSCVEWLKRFNKQFTRPERRRAIKAGVIDTAIIEAGKQRA